MDNCKTIRPRKIKTCSLITKNLKVCGKIVDCDGKNLKPSLIVEGADSESGPPTSSVVIGPNGTLRIWSQSIPINVTSGSANVNIESPANPILRFSQTEDVVVTSQVFAPVTGSGYGSLLVPQNSLKFIGSVITLKVNGLWETTSDGPHSFTIRGEIGGNPWFTLNSSPFFPIPDDTEAPFGLQASLTTRASDVTQTSAFMYLGAPVPAPSSDFPSTLDPLIDNLITIEAAWDNPGNMLTVTGISVMW